MALWVLVALVFLTPVMLYALKGVHLENDVAAWLPEDDPEARVLAWSRERVQDFNNDLVRTIQGELEYLREPQPGDGSIKPKAPDDVTQLERLAALREMGHLTGEEFEARKKRILEG